MYNIMYVLTEKNVELKVSHLKVKYSFPLIKKKNKKPFNVKAILYFFEKLPVLSLVATVDD